MIPPALSKLKELNVEPVRTFLSTSLVPGHRIETLGKAFKLVGPRGMAGITSTTLMALAAGVLAALDGVSDLSYEDLWRYSAHKRVEELSPSGRRKYAETLRNDWDAMLAACAPFPADRVTKMPSSRERIPLAILFPPFDRSRAVNALHKLMPPSLDVHFDGDPRPPIILDVLEPNEWKVVGHARSAEPVGKIAIDHDIHLSRQAFEIKLEGHCLHVRAMPDATNKPVFLDQPSPAFVLHNGDEFRVGKLTFRFQGARGESDTATPRYAARDTQPHEFE